MISGCADECKVAGGIQDCYGIYSKEEAGFLMLKSKDTNEHINELHISGIEDSFMIIFYVSSMIWFFGDKS